jgi:hypothetical protein
VAHRVEYTAQADGQHRAFCSCRLGSPLFPTRVESEEWGRAHLRLAARAMAHLRDRTPSLKDQYDYYLEQAQNPSETPENRRLWRLLADGLASRLPPDRNLDDTLPIEVKYTPRRTERRPRP